MTDDDFSKLSAVLGDKLTWDFAESIIGHAESLCDFREVFGQESRVAKLIRDGDIQVFRMNMFEGRGTKFDVEYDPKTKKITRIL